jgi:hypothetical protein
MIGAAGPMAKQTGNGQVMLAGVEIDCATTPTEVKGV